MKIFTKVFNFLLSPFVVDTEYYESKMRRLKELQAEEAAIIEQCGEKNEISEMDKIKMDILRLKIDNLIK